MIDSFWRFAMFKSIRNLHHLANWRITNSRSILSYFRGKIILQNIALSLYPCYIKVVRFENENIHKNWNSIHLLSRIYTRDLRYNSMANKLMFIPNYDAFIILLLKNKLEVKTLALNLMNQPMKIQLYSLRCLSNE